MGIIIPIRVDLLALGNAICAVVAMSRFVFRLAS